MSKLIYKHHFTKGSFDWIVELYEDKIEFYNGEGTRLYESVPFADILGIDYDEMEEMGGSLCIRAIGGVRSNFSFEESDRGRAQEYVSYILEHALTYAPVFVLSVNNDCEVRYNREYFGDLCPEFYVNDFGDVTIFALLADEMVFMRNTTFEKGEHIPYGTIQHITFRENEGTDDYTHFVLSFSVGDVGYEVWVDQKNLSEMRACVRALSSKVRSHAQNEERKEVFTLTDATGNIYEFDEEHIIQHCRLLPSDQFYDREMRYDDIYMYEIIEGDVVRCQLYQKDSLKPSLYVDCGMEFVQAIERFANRKLINIFDYITEVYGERGELLLDDGIGVFYKNYCIFNRSGYYVVPYSGITLVAIEKCSLSIFSRIFDRYAPYFASYDFWVGYHDPKSGEQTRVRVDVGASRQKKYYKLFCQYANENKCEYISVWYGKVQKVVDGKYLSIGKNCLFDKCSYIMYQFDKDAIVIDDFQGKVRQIHYQRIHSVELTEIGEKRQKYLYVSSIYEKSLFLDIKGDGTRQIWRRFRRILKKKMKKATK